MAEKLVEDTKDLQSEIEDIVDETEISDLDDDILEDLTEGRVDNVYDSKYMCLVFLVKVTEFILIAYAIWFGGANTLCQVALSVQLVIILWICYDIQHEFKWFERLLLGQTIIYVITAACAENTPLFDTIIGFIVVQIILLCIFAKYLKNGSMWVSIPSQ